MPIGTGTEPLEGGVQRHWPLRRGDRVTHPDYRDEAPRLEAEDYRPAYQDPPIIGTVLVAETLSGYAHVNFPGVGVRMVEPGLLTRCEL